jgi:ribosomal protein L37AE/L43A
MIKQRINHDRKGIDLVASDGRVFELPLSDKAQKQALAAEMEAATNAPKCPTHGTRKNVSLGKRPVWWCPECNRTKARINGWRKKTLPELLGIHAHHKRQVELLALELKRRDPNWGT